MNQEVLREYTLRVKQARRTGPVYRWEIAEEMRLALVSYDAAKPVLDHLFGAADCLEKSP